VISDVQKKLLSKESYDFEELAFEIFAFQKEHNPFYKSYVNLLNRPVKDLTDIPFLPIQFFKSEAIKTGSWETKHIFKSSGTTGQTRSQHHVQDNDFYQAHATKLFEVVYGPIQNINIIALLPSYQNRPDSSLISMVQHFMEHSKTGQVTYHNVDEALLNEIDKHSKSDSTTLILGVSFALLDLAELNKVDLGDQFIVMETGGMKGRRTEMTKAELHEKLCNGLGCEKVHSEYGMTELLSQCYSSGGGLFSASQSMKVLAFELQDPFTICKLGKAGSINVIDLANVATCSFIATEDLGKIRSNGQFEIVGRKQLSDIRGCNLLWI